MYRYGVVRWTANLTSGSVRLSKPPYPRWVGPVYPTGRAPMYPIGRGSVLVVLGRTSPHHCDFHTVGMLGISSL